MRVVYTCLKLCKYIRCRINIYNPLLLFVKHKIREPQSLSDGPLSLAESLIFIKILNIDTSKLKL